MELKERAWHLLQDVAMEKNRTVDELVKMLQERVEKKEADKPKKEFDPEDLESQVLFFGKMKNKTFKVVKKSEAYRVTGKPPISTKWVTLISPMGWVR